MRDIDIAVIKKRSVSGILALTTRTFLLQLIAFGATFLLTIFLSPAVFGIFTVVSAVISFLGYFSDIGLAAALIQKKDDISDDDLKTTFTIQQTLVGTMTILALVFSRSIASFYRLDTAGLWLFRALVCSFFLSSLKTIPSVLLERRLEFQKLVIPTIAETLGFYIVAVLLAWLGWGIASFTIAVLVRGVVGLVVIYWIRPWNIRVGYSRQSLSTLLRFGFPFQLNSFLALLKDDLLTVYLGKILPFSQVGYIGWAKKWAEVPLRLIMDSVIRVTFPAFSRLQRSSKYLEAAIEKTLFGLSASIFPITVGLLFFVEPLVAVLPRYGKWEPALLSFYLFALASAVASLSTPLTNALNAVGRIRTTLQLMVGWTVITWILTVLLVRYIGFNGVALSLFLITSSLAIVVRLVKRVVPFSFWQSVRMPLFCASLQGIWYAAIRGRVPDAIGWLLLVGGSGVILYGGLLWYLEKPRVRSLVAIFRT